jgi:hypothetical protein
LAKRLSVIGKKTDARQIKNAISAGLIDFFSGPFNRVMMQRIIRNDVDLRAIVVTQIIRH